MFVEGVNIFFVVFFVFFFVFFYAVPNYDVIKRTVYFPSTDYIFLRLYFSLSYFYI